MNPLIWVEFEGVLSEKTDKALRFTGPSRPGAMGPTWIPRSCLGRMLFANGIWRRATHVNQPLGKAVCALEIDASFARTIGLA